MRTPPKMGVFPEEPVVERDGKSKDRAIEISREELCILADNADCVP